MSELLRRLLAGFFFLPIEGEGEGAEGSEGEGAEGAEGAEGEGESGAGEGEGEEGEGEGEEGEGEQKPKKGETSAELRERVRVAEENARIARDAAESVQRSQRGGAPQSDEERQHEEEDRKLKDPKTPQLERWQIESNRTMRANARASQTALRQAQDLSDKTNFDLKCSANRRLAAVAEEVETRLTKIRQQGQNTSREALAYYVLGEKIANAKEPGQKLKPKEDPLRARGPQARSDVRSKGPLTDREKRVRRLENQII